MTALTLTPRPPAGTRVEIPVRQEHIGRGMPGRSCDCALALAIAGAIPGCQAVAVSPDADDGCRPHARAWIGPASWIRLVFGDDARIFVERFDAMLPVKPAVFAAEVA